MTGSLTVQDLPFFSKTWVLQKFVQGTLSQNGHAVLKQKHALCGVCFGMLFLQSLGYSALLLESVIGSCQRPLGVEPTYSIGGAPMP